MTKLLTKQRLSLKTAVNLKKDFSLAHINCYLWINLQRDLTPPYVDDGLIEIVGFRNAWHGLVLLSPNGHGTRLAQV